ncbi:MAG: choice-of-anchor F family protein, partial [Halopseudomonas sp.]
VSQATLAATVEDVNTINLSVPPVEGKTLVYTDIGTRTSGLFDRVNGAGKKGLSKSLFNTFGWLDPVNDSGVIGLGLAVYNEAFSGRVDGVPYNFAGCIMAQPDLDVNCQAPGDSGKRFKLKTTETNGPIDLVFNVVDDAAKLYRVIGKFSNLTDITNSAAGGLKAFRFETGFGVGNAFRASSADDGLAFGFSNAGTGKLSIGPVGKYPGGLFGGSRVEGLPFFSTSIAEFIESPATVLDQDRLETNGEIPTPYADLAGIDSGWLALANVPTGWFIDHDGNPANDSILLAYDDPTTAVEDWKTYEKIFQDVPVDAIAVDETVVPGTSATVYDPNGSSFATAIDAGGNMIAIDASNVKPLVDTLDEGDPGDLIADAITLGPSTASALYVANYNNTDAGFKVLIDGAAVEVAPFGEWASTPVTVIDTSSSNALFATWNPDPDPTVEGEDGIYEVAPAYAGMTIPLDTGTIVAPATLTLDEMLAISGPPDSTTSTLVRQPGYLQGAIEDLANVNINTTISVANTSSWPTCGGDGSVTNCTFTLRVTGLNGLVEEPTDFPGNSGKAR